MKKNAQKIIVTHIQTLSDNTPKARRRIRVLLGLAKDAPVTAANVATAMLKAATAERTHNAPSGKKR